VFEIKIDCTKNLFSLCNKMEQEKTSTYTKNCKAFYERHRDEILAREKENKRWLKYYADNKEAISQRRKERRKALKEKKKKEEAELDNPTKT
jgi:hypothetical protein